MNKVLPLYILSFVLLGSITVMADENLKQPNVSGQFYPGSADELTRFMDAAIAQVPQVPQDKKIQLLISPHAGYVYSGGVAAYGYKAIAQNHYSTIVIIGASHFHGYEGVAIWPKGQFQTPLGVINIDEQFSAELVKRNPQIKSLPEVFSPEHSLEVQLPFLQKDFKEIKIVTLLMGSANYEVSQKLAVTLNELIAERDDVLVLISTDLSHYHDDKTARGMDDLGMKTILALNPELLWQEARAGTTEMCGFAAVLTGMHYAKLRGLNAAKLLRYANSGDVTGDRSRVVGYSSIIFYADPVAFKAQNDSGIEPLNKQQKVLLLETARKTVELYVKENKVSDFHQEDSRLNEIEGAFVTLKKHGELRGCIGNIIGQAPLWQTVRAMAVAASSQDHRFSPVVPEELKDIEVEVSVLSNPRRISDPREIKLGTHGVIVSQGSKSGVFLPQVATDTGWSLDQFMGELCSQKAGLATDCWKDPKTTIEIFSADVFSEKDLH